MAQEQRQQRQIQIKLTDEIMPGVPANMMGVSHTKEEFVLDFMNVYPAQGQGIVTSRVIVTPSHMKRIAAAIADNLKKYEAQFGKIEESAAPSNEIGFRAE